MRNPLHHCGNVAMNEEEDRDLRHFQPPLVKVKSCTTHTEGRFEAPTSNEEMACGPFLY